jgi:RNA polymerase sigma factor (sigma-70 family)
MERVGLPSYRCDMGAVSYEQAGEPSEIEGWSSRPLLLRLCLRWTRGDLAEAEDLLGDACLRVMEAQSRTQAGLVQPISFWATVINNLGRDRIRRTRRWRFEDGTQVSALLRALPSPTVSAEHQVLLRESLAEAARRLERLNGKQRTAVLLRTRGSGYSTIAKVLGTSQANARKLVETARSALVSSAPRSGKSRAGGRTQPQRPVMIED